MDKLIRIKKKSEEFSLRKIAKRKLLIKARLLKLIERERQYQVSSERLLKASRDSRDLYSGISGLELKERRSWGDRAMYLRHFSEEKLKVITIDLLSLENEEAREIVKLHSTKSKLNIIDTTICRNLKLQSIQREVGEFDELYIASPTDRTL